MKNPPSPSSSPSTPFPSPDISRLSPNSNRSNPEVNSSGSPTRKRERVRSFVKSIRRTSSQLFKKDKKDGESKKSAISALVSDSLGASTAVTAPHILRKLSHSKQPSMTSVTTAESNLSTGYLEVKVGPGEGSINSPIIEVDTPVTPTVLQPLDPTPMGPLKEEDLAPGTELSTVQTFPSLGDPSLVEVGSQPTEAALEGPDLQFPLPPSPVSSTYPIIDPFDSIQISLSEREAKATTGDVTPHDNVASHHDNSPPQHEPQGSSPSDRIPPGLDRAKEDQEMRDLCIPVLIPPMLFWPISNMRLTYFFTPLLTWWLSKGVLSYPYLYS
jgi:hypothetical protein